MVFDRSGEVQPGIEEACNSCYVLGEELDECWWTKDSWVGLMHVSFHRGSLGITGDDNSFLFECWQTEESWGGLMTELFNGREIDITVNDISMLFEWQELRLKPWLSQGVLRWKVQEIEDTGKDKSDNSSDVVGEVNESGSEKNNIPPTPNEPDRGIY